MAYWPTVYRTGAPVICMKYELINAIPRIAFSISTAVHRVKTQFGEKFSEEVFEIDWRNFYTNLLELFCQCISWTNWVNSGKFMDKWENTVIFYDGYWWISCRHSEELRGNISRRAKHGGRYWPSIPMNEAWYSPISIIKNDSIHIVTQ